MPFNIDQFRSNALIEGGVLRTNHFMMRIPMVPAFQYSNHPDFQDIKVVDDNIEFVCDSTNFPMTGVDVHGVRRYGYGAIERKPTFPIFSNLFATFICDNHALVHWFFHEWLKVTVNNDFGGDTGTIRSLTNSTGSRATGPLPMSVYEISYKHEYAVDINLLMYNPQGEEVRNISFRQAYPIVVPDLRLGWGQMNEMVKIPVMFTFFDWHDNELTQTTSQPTDSNLGPTPDSNLPPLK